MEEDIKVINDDFNNYYEIQGKRIGKGGFGEVFKVRDKETNEIKALKTLELDTEYNGEEEIEYGVNLIINELKNMIICSVKKKNLYSVELYKCYRSENQFAFVMELCDKNLLKEMNERKMAFKPEEIYKIMNQLNETFKIMLKNNIVHRDLKLENILIKYIDEEKKDYIVKLTDYGVSKQITKSKICKSHVGTGMTMAPEVLEGKEIYDNKCDLWSVGIIMYKLTFNEYPYNGQTEFALLNNIKSLGQRAFKTSDNNNLNNLIRSLLVYEPTRRLEWSKYFSHPFFIYYRAKEDYKKYYELSDKIGKGAFGSVYKAKSKFSEDEFAIKIIDIDNNNEEAENGIKGLINELYNMSICSNDNKNNYSVNFYEYFKYEKEFIIVMELCDDNLEKVLKNRKNVFKPEEIYKIMSQLNETFKIMVKNKIIHRDIKLENILVKFEGDGNNFIVKLTDYGISKQVSSTTMIQTVAGTKLTMAPEILEGKKYNNKCDLWSIGAVIYKLAFNKYPYDGKTDIVLVNNIKEIGQKELVRTNNIFLDDLIRSLLVYEAKKRISWEDYFSHPFFKFNSNIKYTDIYKTDGKIGKGAFGDVYKAKEIKTGKIVALKKIYIDNDSLSEEDINYATFLMTNELKSMKICRSKDTNEYSVKLYDYYRNDNEYIIIMELCDDNLKNLLKERKKFNLEEIRKIMLQLNNTFKVMVENNIVHRDLKLENILIKYIDKQKKDFIVKLTDYGVSKQITTTQICQSKVGTDCTMAPEVLEGKDTYNNKCDLWSIGVIIYQLLYNDFPYKGQTQIALFNNIKNLGLNSLNKPEDSNLKDLIFRLLIKDPKERITWEDYFNHPFFSIKEQNKSSNDEIQTNQITIEIKVSERDKEKYGNKIYFLENNSAKIIDKEIENFKELNNDNTELYINNVRKDFKKYIETSSKEGDKYTIKLIIKNKIKSCNSMFYGCLHIKSIDLSLFDSSEVKDMSLMFCKCFYLEELKLGNLNTEKVTNMQKMFQKCKSLEKINFGPSFTTKNVKDISLMFADCWSIKDLLVPFDTQNVENMKGLFLRCYNLTKIDLNSFKTDKVKKMELMCDGCTRLEEIKFDPEKFKTNSVEFMGHMFNNCQSLKLLKLNGFITENVKFMNSMFANCLQLITVDLSSFSNKKCYNITHMFDGCINLKKVNLSNFVDNNNYKFNNMFDNCPTLEEVKVKNESALNQFKKEFENINFRI